MRGEERDPSRMPASDTEPGVGVVTPALLSHARCMQRSVPFSVTVSAARLRRGLALVSLAAAMMVLTACTEQSSTTDFNGWYEKMQTVFSDENGSGGGGGPAPGSVELRSMRTGHWVVYAVCNDTEVLHLRVRGGSTILAETDVPCGVTIGVPIEVSSAAARQFEIQTSHPKGKTGTGWWAVQVNSTSWKQPATFRFN